MMSSIWDDPVETALERTGQDDLGTVRMGWQFTADAEITRPDAGDPPPEEPPTEEPIEGAE